MRYIESYLQLPSIGVFHRCWIAEPMKDLIIGVHGFAEHSGRYDHIGRELANNGYTLCMHDLRGHGRTARTDRDLGYIESFDVFIRDLELFIDTVTQRFSLEDVVLFGHSMGGLIVLHYLARVGKKVRKAIVSGAATKIEVNPIIYGVLSLLNAIAPRMRLSLPIKPELLSHDRRVVEEYIRDPLVFKKPTVRLLYELVRASRDIWRYVPSIEIPILILHGEEDKIVPPSASIELYNRIGSREKELKIYRGMYHEILNELEWRRVLQDILDWLIK